ncbi:MAG: DUF47 family protein [Angelakisella sp.]
MSKKSELFYFNKFIESAEVSCEAARMLQEVLEHFDATALPDTMKKMHEIEHKGDDQKHEMMSELVRAFITPLERGDIISLSQNIDDVTDSIEDILIHIYITNVTVIHPECIAFAALLIRCCAAMKNLLNDFSNFRKSKQLSTLIIEINRIEEEGDKLYFDAMRKLHTTETNPLMVIAWREIYGFFEKCCDACEDVADIVEGIVIGNT